MKFAQLPQSAKRRAIKDFAQKAFPVNKGETKEEKKNAWKVVYNILKETRVQFSKDGSLKQ